ncbi:MAG TPA: type I DNA topoisomerase, partial [Anaerolineae bacterium]|nr:type I DNA topoisomerase [Anaerolineae bacterium]
HVRDLLKSRLSVDVDHNYEPEYRVPNDKRKVVKELKAAAARAKEIYLATDPDREGEAIAWHVLESAEMEPTRTQRVVFHEITKTAILKAMESPRQIDMERVNAQQARRILDRLVGYKLSPLLWRKVRGRLSAGRVQSVTLRMIVEREREIEKFEPVEFWTVEADLQQQPVKGKEKPPFRAKWHRYQGEKLALDSEADVKPHLAKLEAATWNVGKIKLGKRTRKPRAPFTTSTLQQEASSKLGFGTNKTMRVAQQLYEGIDLGDGEGAVGLITYMRTDSVTVSKEAQAAAREYIRMSFGTEYMPASAPIYKTRSKSAQEAHEAVRPTGVMRLPKQIKDKLKRDQLRLYQLIWSRFVASQMSPAIYDTVTADIYAGEAATPITKRPYWFRSSGSSLRFAGFLKLYEETSPSDKPADTGKRVPADLKDADLLNLLKLFPEQHFTQPPPRFNEASLVKTLEELGIGRPSTYASIISTIIYRGYVVKEEKRLYPTEIGATVIDLLVEYFPTILSADFTSEMEERLDLIAQGKADWVKIIDDFYVPFREKLAIA